ncbi:unnamed protein product [Durusdinium trenchii]|uniref:VPS9 domain-containing protein n=2 Tax=Durusdinium trenchii TaxID=1381693 RepID=A0ABP0PXD3_9DINO
MAEETEEGPGYSHAHFLELLKHPSAQCVVNDIRDFVNEFPANLTRVQAARRIHHFLPEVTLKLLSCEAFQHAEQQMASEGLEKFVVLKLFKLLFRHDPADVREDERAEKALSEAAGETAAPLLQQVSKLSSKQQETFDQAAGELKKVEHFRAPRDKLSCFANAICLLENVVEERVFLGSGDAAESSWINLLAALILKASPPNLYSNLEFTISFRHPSRLSDHERKCLSDLSSAFRLLCGARMSEQVAGQPLWLMDAGVSFAFLGRQPEELLFGEVEELVDEYQKMIRALRDLTQDQHGKRTFDT